MKTFIFDQLWGKLAKEEHLRKLDGLDVTIIENVTSLSKCRALFEGKQEKVICINPDYVNWTLKKEDFQDIPNLKAILPASTAYDWIDVESASAQGVAVCNIKNFSTRSVAEYVVNMISNLARQMPRLVKDGWPLDFDADFMKYRGIELQGKTIGIIGLGNIGSEIAEIMYAMGMNVAYWSQNSRNDKFQFMELDELCKSVDVIVPALARNEATEKLITKDMLVSLKKTAIVATPAHSLMDEKCLIERVANGKLFGFGFEAEPGTFEKYEGNVWAIPAYAWATEATMTRSLDKLTDNIVAVSKGEYPNRVN